MNSPLEELAALYVLDRLEPGERADFEAQLLRSPELAAHVRELESALAREVQALPQRPPPPALLARIESRLDRVASVRAAIDETMHRRAFSWGGAARWGVAAVIAVSVATLAIQSLRRTPNPAPVVLIVGLGSHASSPATLALSTPPADAESSFVQLATLAEKFWANPAGLPATPVASGPPAHGYAIFDPGSSQGFIAVRQLPAPAPGQRYYLWVVDTASGRVAEAGALPADGAASGLYSFNASAPAQAGTAQLSFFVTAEDATIAKPAQPRGKVVLGNKEI